MYFRVPSNKAGNRLTPPSVYPESDTTLTRSSRNQTENGLWRSSGGLCFCIKDRHSQMLCFAQSKLRGMALRKLCSFLALASFVLQPLQSASFDHSPWDRLLKSYVNQRGEVDYAALKADRTDLDEYVRRLGESSPANRPEQFPNTAAQLAYWLNAYNALVVRGVVDNYPTRGVLHLGYFYGFFRRKDYIAGGTRLSLKHIEDKIVRQQYGDPRIHFALVCASISCPLLPREAFTHERLDEQLERLARQFINNQRNVTVRTGSREVWLNQIFDWYKKDFEEPKQPGRRKQSLLDYLRRYLQEDKRKVLDGVKKPKIKYYRYNWDLNGVGSRSEAKPRGLRRLP